MRFRIELAVFVCLLFVFGVNLVSEGAKLEEFEMDMKAYEEHMKKYEDMMNTEIRDASDKIDKAATGDEKKAAYTEYQAAYAKVIENDHRVDDALNLVLKDLEDAHDWFDDNPEKVMSFKDEVLGMAEDMKSLLEDTKNAVPNIKESFLGTDPELGKLFSEAAEKTVATYNEVNKEIFEMLNVMSTGGSMTGKAVEDMALVLNVYKQILNVSSMVHKMEFLKAAVVGKVVIRNQKVIKVLENTFKVSVDKHIEGLALSAHDTHRLNTLMISDMQEGSTQIKTSLKDIKGGMKLALANIKRIPTPGSLDDGNPDHVYFLDTKKNRWYWQQKGDLRGEKHWAPFDYVAGTGIFLKFKDGKAYSFAQGTDIEILPDAAQTDTQ